MSSLSTEACAVIEGRHSDPFRYLGPHVEGDVPLVRIRRALASRRRSLTSSEVAARAVSPASRFLPASRKSFDQR